METSNAEPLEFLKMFSGFEHKKVQLCKAEALLSNVDSDISVNKSLQIKTTDFFKSLNK